MSPIPIDLARHTQHDVIQAGVTAHPANRHDGIAIRYDCLGNLDQDRRNSVVDLALALGDVVCGLPVLLKHASVASRSYSTPVYTQ